MTKTGAFRYFKTSPEIIRLAVMLYVRFPLSLRNVEDLLHERGIDVSYETIRFWCHWFGPTFASEMRKHDRPDFLVTDKPRSYEVTLKEMALPIARRRDSG